MLSIIQIRGDGTYYTSIGRDDYLLNGGEPQGVWLGEGAGALGLTGLVEDVVYRRLMGGFSPDGSEELVRNAGTESRRPGWDLTFSAPKSVSEFWAASREIPGLEKIVREAQWAAAERVVRYLEEVAGEAREGLGGHTRTPVRLVVAGFEHSTSRNLDPQLHCHCVVINIGVRLDGVTRTVVSKAIYRQKMTAGALYRAELASQLRQKLGLEFVAKASWFEVSGVPQSLIDEGSSRRKEILAELEKSGFSGPKAAKIVARDTRETKKVIPREELFERWGRVAASHGFGTDKVRELIRPGLTQIPSIIPAEIVAASIDKILERQSFFSERELVRVVAEKTQTMGFGVDRIVATSREALSRLVPLGEHQRERQFTTLATLELERTLIAQAVAGRDDRHQTLSSGTIEKVLRNHTLSAEQENALRHITQKPGAVQVVSGLAGTGKSTLLAATRECFEAEGFEVIGCSLSGKAAEGLQRSSGISSHTIARVLHQWGKELSEVRRLHPKSVLVVDEAAMVGTRQLAALFEQAQKAGCRVILVGDARQLPAIQAGAPFVSLSRILGMATLKDIRRQLAEWGRVMVRQFADGDVREGVEILRRQGLIHIGPTPEATTQQLLSEWAKETDLKNVLILVGTHEEVNWLNREAQRIRKDAGLLGTSSCVIGEREFHPGDRVIFGRNDRKLGVKNGTFGTLIRQQHGSAVIQLDQSNKCVFVPLNNEHIRLGYAVTTHKSQGATTQRTFVLFSDSMQSRESTYVQVSRAREFTKLFLTREQAGDTDLKEAVRAMERSQAKMNASDLVSGDMDVPVQNTRARPIDLHGTSPIVIRRSA